VREELDRARLELEAARRAGNLGRMAELQYGKIRSLEKRLSAASAAEEKAPTLVRNKVTEEEIAEVGVQVDRHPGVQDARGREGEAAAHGGGARKRVVGRRRRCAS